MAGFRDICLQVKYQGGFADLTSDFFQPASAIALLQRAHVCSLSRETLLPLSLHFNECRKAGKSLQLLVSLIRPEGGTDAPGETKTAEVDVVGRCFDELKWVPTAEDEDGAIAKNDCALSVRLAVDTATDTAAQSSTRCFGQMVDEFGNGVEYIADWGEDTVGNGEKQHIEVSWSWGDPSFRVTKGIRRSDMLWDGGDPNTKTVTASDEVVHGIRKALEELIRNPGLIGGPKHGRELFRHQKEAVEEWIAKDCRGVFKMCTGAGKTIAALAGARLLAEQRHAAGAPRPSVVITVPTRILADQWIEEIKQFGFPGVLAAYNAFEQWSELLEPSLRCQQDGHPRFVVTTYCSFVDARFVSRLKRAGAAGAEALWIADEMHNLSSPRLRQAMRDVSGVFRFRLGLSATPDIEGDFSATEFLKDYFGSVCKTYELRDGIADRVLCRYRYYPIPAFLAPSLGGRYLELLSQIHGQRVDPSKLINLYRLSRQLLRTSGVQLSRFAELLRQLVAVDSGMAHTLVYCPPGYGTYGSDVSDEIDHDTDELRLIESVVEILRNNGLSTSSILGETPGSQRKEILKRFGKGALQTLCAIGCLDEGVDVPSIKRAVVLYSVDREKQFVQRRGRILRNPTRDDQKIAEIYDILLLPQGTDMPTEQAEILLTKELRRYRTFADLAMNREEADEILSGALKMATQ